MYKENKNSHPDKDDKEASWNSALESAKRLAYWIQVGNQHCYDKNYPKYKDCLIIFFKEISPKLNDKEIEDVNKKLKEIYKEEENYNKELIKNSDEENISFMSDYPTLLDEFDMKLRRYADKKGLLIPDKKSIYDSEE